MASRTAFVPIREKPFICDGCLSATKVAHHARPTAVRTFAIASSSRCDITPRTSLYQLPRIRRTRISVQSSLIYLPPRRQSRAYSTEVSAPDPLHTGTALLRHRRLLAVSGADAAKFLQGLITNNVDSTRLSPFYSAILDARGRMLWDVFVWVWPELVAEKSHWACYIEVDANELEALKKHLKKHKLRSKIKIEDVDTEGENGIRVWAAWGGAHEHVKPTSEIAGMQDPRAEGLYRYLTDGDRENIAEDLQPVDSKYYHFQRYLQGVPEGPAEIPRENALPMEYNVDLSGGIDFKKGCYVGQELTIRTKHTGVVRKRVLPVQLHNAASTPSAETLSYDPNPGLSIPLPEPSSDIKALDSQGTLKKGRATGKFLSGIGNIGLALCRLENMTPMRVSAEGGTYTDGAEFGIDINGQTVKVVPVLHPWFVKRKEALWDKREVKKRFGDFEDE